MKSGTTVDSVGIPSKVDWNQMIAPGMKLFDLPIDVILKNNIAAAIPAHVEKWPSPYYQTVNDWEDLLDKISDDNEYRINYALQHVSDNLQLDSIASLSFDIFPGNSGKIKINTITPNTYPWSGIFFKSQCPSKISALASTIVKLTFKNSETLFA